MPSYNRILLKLSGEAFKGSREYGIDPEFLLSLAEELKVCQEKGVQLAIVIGGGNIFRGEAAESNGMDRVIADYSGMLATVMNALALQDALRKKGVDSRVQTAIEMREIAEPFILSKAIRHLKKGRIVIFAAGTGNPYFTTDTAAALRAAEIKADLVCKATQVDGVYDSDPKLNPDAKKYEDITYMSVIKNKLKVMDTTALSLCMDNKIPIVVFSISNKTNIKKLIEGEKVGTYIGE